MVSLMSALSLSLNVVVVLRIPSTLTSMKKAATSCPMEWSLWQGAEGGPWPIASEEELRLLVLQPVRNRGPHEWAWSKPSLSWAFISLSRGSSWPRGRTGSSCIAGEFFTAEPQGSIWVEPSDEDPVMANILTAALWKTLNQRHNLSCIWVPGLLKLSDNKCSLGIPGWSSG